MDEPVTESLENKKQHRRFRKRYLLRHGITVFEHPTNIFLGDLLDISDMGMKIASQEPIAVYRFIKMRLSLPTPVSETEFIDFDSICIWNRQEPVSSGYSNGFQILNITDRNKILLQAMVKTYRPDSQ